jgi:hypothetical protein
MRRATVFLSLLSVLLIAACSTLYVKTRQDAEALDVSKRGEATTRAHYEQAIQDISAIQDSLNAIAVDAAQAMQVSSLGAERRLSPTGASETLERIAGLRTRIRSLESRLRQSDLRVAGLDKLGETVEAGAC